MKFFFKSVAFIFIVSLVLTILGFSQKTFEHCSVIAPSVSQASSLYFSLRGFPVGWFILEARECGGELMMPFGGVLFGQFLKSLTFISFFVLLVFLTTVLLRRFFKRSPVAADH